MATATSFPPNDANRAAQQAVPGARATPGVVGALSGSLAVGPEAAGALILLHTTFADDEGAQRGYRLFTEIKTHMLASPGFLHWFTFSDGPNGYALGLWRTPEEATAFVRSDAHRAMAREQQQRPFEYSQFAGMWTTAHPGTRSIYCERCHQPTAAPAERCASCANGLDDTFAVKRIGPDVGAT
jgi:heme-degrading monooxygenase HmoA